MNASCERIVTEPSVASACAEATRTERLERTRLPHFVIIGAPKCGTTALHAYLQTHPGAFMAQDRAGRSFETQYFCTDFPGISHFDRAEDYQALFDRAPAKALRGESSPWYLFSKVAVPQLLTHVPDAKLIVMLRNPVDMAASLHAQLIMSLREDVEHFEHAWQLQDARRQGGSLPRHCREPSHLQYGQVCSFAPQLERLFRHAPRDQVKVILLDEFVAQPRATYLSVLEFLGLPDDGRTDFPKVNVRSAYRNRTLIGALQRLPPGLDPLLYRAKRIANRSGLRPIRLLKRMNGKPAAQVPLDPVFRARLSEFFAKDVRATERLLGRSLDAWRTEVPAAA